MIWPRREFRLSGISMTAAMILLMFGGATWAQVPGLPVTPAPAKSAGHGNGSDPSEKAKPAVASTGPITVHQEVPDLDLFLLLSSFFPKYPGIRQITVAVDDGAVTL